MTGSATDASPSPETSSVSPAERLTLWLLLGLTAGLLLARLASAEALGSANDRSRWCTVWSLATRGTYQIDEIISYPGWDTIDKVRHEDHFYSTKPALYPTLLAGAYSVLNNVTGLSLGREPDLTAGILLLFVNVLPYLAALYVFWRALIGAEFSSTTRVLIIALLALATPLTAYLSVLNNHTAGATGLLIALATYLFLRRDSSKEPAASGWLYAACGFAAAWTCCQELPAALFGLAIFGLVWRQNARKAWLCFVPAALIPLAGFFITTYIATGGWKPFYMYYGTEKYVYEYLGIPSYWANPQGVDRARDTVPQYIFHCLIGHHGVFSLTPLFLLAIPGYFWGLKQTSGGRKELLWMGLLLTVAIFAFYWKRTENYNYGGVSVALRWVVWLIPFWLLAIGEWSERISLSRKTIAVLLLLGIPSLFSVWEPWTTPWQQPWLFRELEARGMIDYSDPPKPLAVPRYTWISQLPDSTEQDDEYWCELTNRLGQTMRIADAGPADSGRSIQVELFDEGNLIRTRQLTIDTEAFRAGKSPQEFLLAWEDSRPEATKADQLSFLRGVDEPSAYRVGHFRHLFLPLRENAFRCRRLASRVTNKDASPFGSLEQRIDVWSNAELPFGIAQFQLATSEMSPRELTSRTTWSATAAGKLLTPSGETQE
ncbi:MAG: hypothetical protein ACE37I_01220 [Rubinisphaera brasiliensis]|uniref:hypothetical protein n=1 Tax=Rubinisphaera brasiliensis TaxID=119 RepID=UPI00391B56BB